MKKTLSFIAALSILATATLADVITTHNGSTINGKILGIDGGKVKIATDFAGELEIDQSKIASFSTDNPIFLSFESGSSYNGQVTGSSDGSLSIATADGTLSTSVSKVKEGWNPGEKSPAMIRQEAEVAKLQRKWSHQAAVDISGKSGNSDANGLGLSYQATLKGPKDKLVFFGKANFEETDNNKSADDARGGVEYSNKFTDVWNWYVRSEIGRDAIKAIDLFSNTAVGFGYNFADTETRSINLRGGIGYRFESYGDMRADLSSASLDVGLLHSETTKWGKINNRITLTPAFDDLGNLRIYQDSSIDLPLKTDRYSVRLGFSNDYDSEALAPVKELDTTYYIRLVVNWD